MIMSRADLNLFCRLIIWLFLPCLPLFSWGNWLILAFDEFLFLHLKILFHQVNLFNLYFRKFWQDEVNDDLLIIYWFVCGRENILLLLFIHHFLSHSASCSLGALNLCNTEPARLRLRVVPRHHGRGEEGLLALAGRASLGELVRHLRYRPIPTTRGPRRFWHVLVCETRLKLLQFRQIFIDFSSRDAFERALKEP